MKASTDSLKGIAKDDSLSDLLLAWYTVEKRDLPWRRTEDPYAIWISEVMLQQTQVKTVIPYYERFLQRFPDVEQLGTASLDDVLTVWRGLGYYSRARRMWEGARYLLEHWEGKMPGDYESLLQVPGVGEYTAGAIASIAFGQRVAAIDGNVKRVTSRLLAWPEPVETVRSYRRFIDHLKVWQPVLQPGNFNQALMELGAMVCTPKNPDCESCPLVQVCEGYRRGEVLLYPVKRPKAQRQVVIRLTFVLRRDDRVYLQRRPSNGLLANLWEFPGVELNQDKVLEDRPLVAGDEWFSFFKKAVPERAFDERVREQFDQGLKLHGPVWYDFSHRRWKILWVIIDLTKQPEPERVDLSSLRESEEEYRLDSWKVQRIEENKSWISLRDLGVIPLPVAFTAIVEDLTKTAQ